MRDDARVFIALLVLECSAIAFVLALVLAIDAARRWWARRSAGPLPRATVQQWPVAYHSIGGHHEFQVPWPPAWQAPAPARPSTLFVEEDTEPLVFAYTPPERPAAVFDDEEPTTRYVR